MANNSTGINGYRIDSRDKKSVKHSKELDYLLPKANTQEALIALADAVDEDNAKESPERNCYRRDQEFMGFDNPKNLVKVPNRFEARVMCADCPLFDLCNDYAEKARPFGVWGGKVYGRELIFDDEP